MSNPILLAPGPVPLHPEIQRILSLPMIHHRTPEFDAILKSALENLKYVFQTVQPVYILSSTGSGGMECLLVNTVEKSDKVLAIVSGKFGERWADMAEVYGAEVIRLNVPWGKAVDPDHVKELLEKHSDIKIVMMQACETSTATSQDVQAVARLTKSTEALLLVDGITALGAYPLLMDDWGIDGLVGGSQKAFMLPTGASFVSFSKKAWKKVLINKTPKFYFDIKKEDQANQKGETYFSSNVLIIRALDYVLKKIKNEKIETLFQEIAFRAHYTRQMALEMGLKLYSSSPSNSVTALWLPENINGVEFREKLEKKYQVTVMGGQDQLKGKIIRIGHMGYITQQDLHQTTLCLVQCLNDFGFNFNLSSIDQLSQQELLKFFKS